MNIIYQKVNAVAESFADASDDDKLNNLCEVLELTAKVQHELFGAINTLSESSESQVMKTRLLPWMSNGYLGEK